MRSQDLVLSTDAVPAGTVVKWEWYASASVSAGTFNNFSLKLCHTNKTALTTDFTGNYGGNTPVQVYYKSSEYIAATPNTWFGFAFTTGFDYNGKDNLIVEVEWSGDSGGYDYNYWSAATARCMYKYNSYAARVYHYLHYMRITTGALGVAPTSLGRVKALYE